MLKSRDFLCKLTQSVRKIGNIFFEFEKTNLLTAAKAPLCMAPGHQGTRGKQGDFPKLIPLAKTE